MDHDIISNNEFSVVSCDIDWNNHSISRQQLYGLTCSSLDILLLIFLRVLFVRIMGEWLTLFNSIM
jgi:hypothetical protein